MEFFMFCLICMDQPDSHDLRQANRPDHVAYVLASPAVSVAGPFLGEDGETMIGTLIVLDVASRDEAESWAREDPYAKAGLFDRVEIHPWKHLIGGLENPQANG
jgi:uncharacterized protein YciI